MNFIKTFDGMSASVTRLQRALRVCYFGHKPVNYLEASELQAKLANYCRNETSLDTVLQLQHSNVYTLGKRGVQAHFKVPASELAQQGFDIQHAERGGETTYHGPGQLVMYPVVNLRRLGIGARMYVETLEDCMVAACSHFGIEARGRVPSKTGVWVGNRKIGAVGVKISQGVASHGISLNVNTDLQHYNKIVPCGIEDCDITSVGRELQKAVDIDQVAKLLVQHFYDSLNYTGMQQMTPGELFAPGALALA